MARYVLDDKFWEAWIEGSIVTTCSGTKQRRGPELPREYANAVAAQRGYAELVAARESAGYKLASDDAPTAITGARNEELEAAIRAAPEAIEPYLVYADWLQSRGDPRGELITLQHAMRSQPDPAGFAKFKGHEEALRTQYAAVWLGERLATGKGMRFEWAMGFVDIAVLHTPSWDPTRSAPPEGTLVDLLRELLASPCGWLVRVLTLEAPIEQLRQAFELLPTVRLRHVILHPPPSYEEDAKRELAMQIMDMLNHNIDVDLGRYPPEKLRWKR
jgi:uncharacterized protein (TIGR02996 family)